MTNFKDRLPRLSPRGRIGAGAAVLLALGAAGGAGAVSLTRPAIEMAPTVPTAIGKLADSDGVVTVRGRVAETYGDRIVVQDATGRAMVDMGRHSVPAVGNGLNRGAAVMVQGRYDDGQLRASYLVGPDGRVSAVGPAGRGPDDRGHGRPGRDGPPPPPPGAPRPDGAGAPPPPPPGSPVGCAPIGAPPPVGAAPPPPPAGTAPPPPLPATIEARPR